MNPRSSVCAVCVGILLTGTSVGAQESREELIAEARQEFNVPSKMALLARAANPAMAPLDSLWAVAVYDLAAVLIDQDEEEMASLWLRWGARHGSWAIDRDWYAPAVVRAYDLAVPTGLAVEQAADPGVSTTWQWPGELDVDASGVLEVESADPSVAVTVQVEGEGTVAQGGARSLGAGTYELVASAEGHETARVTREVLPGATTVLRFDLVPVLPDAVVDDVSNSLVRIQFVQGGQQVCTSGLIANPDGLVLTSLAPIRGVSGLEVVRSGTAYGGVTVAASDPARNLAVLRFGAEGLPVLARTTDAEAGQSVWAVHHAGCGATSPARTRLASWNPSAGTAPLAGSLTAQALGSPVIDRSGSLLGLVTGPDEVTPMAATEDVLEEAIRIATGEEDEQVSGGGGFPIKWVGAGVAAAGVAALLLSGGDDTGNGNGTGGIVVTWPGGGP